MTFTKKQILETGCVIGREEMSFSNVLNLIRVDSQQSNLSIVMRDNKNDRWFDIALLKRDEADKMIDRIMSKYKQAI